MNELYRLAGDLNTAANDFRGAAAAKGTKGDFRRFLQKASLVLGGWAQDTSRIATSVEHERTVAGLLYDVVTGKIRHTYSGMCPDDIEGWDSRDLNCPACKVIVKAEAQ